MKSIKLNLGCGQTGLEGWVNVDNSPSVFVSRVPFLRFVLYKLKIINEYSYRSVWLKNIIWRDLTKKLNWSDNSVDKIYNSHVLEHMENDKGKAFLKECYRVMKKDAIFRLVVPDLEFHCRRYLKKVEIGESAGREAHDELLFNVYGGYLNKRRYGAEHLYMYDWNTLRLLLTDIGFSQVIRQTYRKGVDNELFLLDNRPEDSLHIDAIK